MRPQVTLSVAIAPFPHAQTLQIHTLVSNSNKCNSSYHNRSVEMRILLVLNVLYFSFWSQKRLFLCFSKFIFLTEKKHFPKIVMDLMIFFVKKKISPLFWCDSFTKWTSIGKCTKVNFAVHYHRFNENANCSNENRRYVSARRGCIAVIFGVDIVKSVATVWRMWSNNRVSKVKNEQLVTNAFFVLILRWISSHNLILSEFKNYAQPKMK